MKVKDLIEKLEKTDQDSLVYLAYEDSTPENTDEVECVAQHRGGGIILYPNNEEVLPQIDQIF